MKKWSVLNYDADAASKLAKGCGVSPLTAAVLASKGYSSAENVMERLECSELSDPFLIKDMDKAVDIINAAIDDGTNICVYGDYDCDGVMATVILYTYLSAMGAEVAYYIPERSEGYGLNKAAIEWLHEQGVQLIVTVDNGISAIDEAEYIYSLGMKLIVTDHHQQGDQLPRAEAVVDPHRRDDLSPFKYTCGAAIAMKLTAALDGGDYTTALAQFGDLAAIATVADIVSLTDENRYIVSYGLELINKTDRPALKALIEVCGLSDKEINSQSIGFSLGPRINAAGRYGSPRTAMELFLCEDDYDRALELSKEIDRLNELRKTAENDIFNDIRQLIDSDPSILRDRVICLFGKGWHHGVIGIVASRIVEKYGKPCFIASEDNGEIRGSARAFGSFSVFDALTASADALERFGGHPAAGGFTVKPGMTQDFRRLVNKYAFENHKVMPCTELTANVRLTAKDITLENVKDLARLEPFGCENEKPLFFIENAEAADIIPLSNGAHSKLRIKVDGVFFSAIMFRTAPHELPVRPSDHCDLMVSLGTNEYMGRTSVSIFISDIRRHGLDQNRHFAAINSFEAYLRGEQLPQNYYAAMMPSRDMAVAVYKLIPETGASPESIFFRLGIPQLNFCRFNVILEALHQLGLISISYAGPSVSRVKVTHKADLNSAPILADIRQRIK